jgi:hypothetical protein
MPNPSVESFTVKNHNASVASIRKSSTIEPITERGRRFEIGLTLGHRG